MTKRDGATISWASYDLPLVINQSGGNSSAFSYAADRQRYKQVSVDSGATKTTVYIQGGVFEKITSGSTTEYKHHIKGADGEVAIHTRRTLGSSDTVYLLKDHLGSTDKIANSSGGILVHLSYDAFGRRRGANWTGTPNSGDWSAIKGNTHRGYTSHEHLDNLNLIHMNGRVYDPALGRFLSADPYVPNPFNGQSFNRFSYVLNSPLSYTDPSGYSEKFEGNDVRTICDGDCAFWWRDYLGSWFDEIQFREWNQETSDNQTSVADPERILHDEYDDDWQWAKDVGQDIADIAILDSVRGVVEVYEAARNGDYVKVATGMAGVACDVAKACKALDKLVDGAKKLLRRGPDEVLRVVEPGKPQFQLRQGEKGLSVFDANKVGPDDVLPNFREGSQTVRKSISDIEACGLAVRCTPGDASLPKRLQDAHMEIRPGADMTRKQFKEALKQLEPNP